MASRTQSQWTLSGRGDYDKLSLNKQAPIPYVGDNDVLVRMKAASFNFRDIAILRNKYPFSTMESVVPLSDGAGVVESVGPQVTRFKKGDKVMPIFTQSHLANSMSPDGHNTTLGGARHGVLRQYATFNEQTLVTMPKGYNFVQAAALPCAGVTAWNALFGLEGRRLQPGHWVLTQGTGGVSLFALQFAKACGARVVATTSSEAKAKRLRELGADRVINYREEVEWGVAARKLTDDIGFHHVIDVGGTATLRQSLQSIAIEGVISIVGFLGEGADAPSFLEALNHTCIVRGIRIGSRAHFEDMVQAIEASKIVPVVDDRVFDFTELKAGYQYLEDQNHFGKVCIRIE